MRFCNRMCLSVHKPCVSSELAGGTARILGLKHLKKKSTVELGGLEPSYKNLRCYSWSISA